MKKMLQFLSRHPVFSILTGLIISVGQTDAAWQQPPHSFAPASGGGMDIGSDDEGNAIVILDDSGDITAFTYTRLTNAWSGPTIIGTSDGVSRVILQVDGTGTALGVWTNSDVTPEFFSSYFNGTTWTPGSPDPFGTAPAGVVARLGNVDMNGPATALAVYGSNEVEVFAAFFNSGVWTAPISLSATGDTIKGAYSENGTAVAIYYEGTSIVARNYIGGTWQAPVTLDAGPVQTIGNQAVKMDANGNAVALWQAGSGDLVSRTFNGTMWLPVVTVSTIDPINFSLDFDMAPNGIGVATWVDAIAFAYSSRYNGTSWGPVIPLAGGVVNVNGAVPSVSLDDAGNALVVYITTLGTLTSADLPVGAGAWTNFQFISTSGAPVTIPFASLSNSGFRFAGWEAGLEGFDYFASVEIAVIDPPGSISGTSCTKKLATGDERINIVTWTASPNSTVVSYNIRRNGVRIANVPASNPLVFFDPRCNNLPTTYSVTAVDENGFESEPLTVIIK